MKRLLIAVLALFLCLFAFKASAWNPMVVVPGESSVATCGTQAAPNDMETQTSTTGYICTSTDSDWYSSAFVSDGSTICSVQVYIGTSTGSDPSYSTLTVSIFSDDGTTGCAGAGCPNAQAATFGSISTVGLGAAPGWYTAPGTGPFVGVNATRYHVVVASNGADNTNQVYWASDITCTTENINYSGTGAASSWTNTSSTYCKNVKLYKAP